MKKILMCLFAFLLLSSGVAIGSSLNGDWNGSPIVKLYSSGKQLDAYDNPPIVLNDHTMIPLYMLKQLGVELTWNQDTYSVYIKMPEKVKIVRPSLTQDQLNTLAKSVGIVNVYQDDKPIGQGSGFILSNGVFITNYHVGAAGNKLRIDLGGQSFYTNGEYMFSDATKDLYAVKIQSNQLQLKVNTTLPNKDDIVYAIGYPSGKLSITDGTVLSVVKDIDGVTKIVNTAKIDHGSSGGILVDDQGQVIGITAQSFDDSTVRMSIPISNVMDKLK